MTRRAVLLKALRATPVDVERLARRGDAGPARSAALSAMLDFERAFRSQLQQVVAEERPVLARLAVQRAEAAADMPLAELVGAFGAARQETLAFLEGLSRADWQRKALQEGLGETSLRFLVQSLVEADTQHLGALLGVQARAGPALVDSPVQSSRIEQSSPNSEVRNERKRTRKWPRSRIRRD